MAPIDTSRAFLGIAATLLLSGCFNVLDGYSLYTGDADESDTDYSREEVALEDPELLDTGSFDTDTGIDASDTEIFDTDADTATTAEHLDSTECVADELVACFCEWEWPGARLCDEGGAWEECICPEQTEPLPIECVPLDTEACTCAIEESGIRECDDNGRWTDCHCSSDTDSDSEVTAPECALGDAERCTGEEGVLGTRICSEDLTLSHCVCATNNLAYFEQGLVGQWHGTVWTKWNGENTVDFSFFENGTYSAHCAGDCRALYWGTDDDTPLKTWSLTYYNYHPEAFGRISIYFTTNVLPGDLEFLRFDDNRNHVEFEVWKGEYGPLVYSLERVN